MEIVLSTLKKVSESRLKGSLLFFGEIDQEQTLTKHLIYCSIYFLFLFNSVNRTLLAWINVKTILRSEKWTDDWRIQKGDDVLFKTKCLKARQF